MDKFFKITFFLMSIPLLAMGQSITGTIVDENSSPIPSVNCVLLNSDSIFINGSISGNDGRFMIPAENEKNYILSISCV